MQITLVGMVSYLHSAGLTLLSFAVLISVIVFFHEVGHLLVGKWLGVKAVRFSIGFGPRLFGVQWGETEYRVSLLPLGGYVKVAGDNPPEQLAPEDRGRGVLEQPPREKAGIAFAGPAPNFRPPSVPQFARNAAPPRFHRGVAPPRSHGARGHSVGVRSRAGGAGRVRRRSGRRGRRPDALRRAAGVRGGGGRAAPRRSRRLHGGKAHRVVVRRGRSDPPRQRRRTVRDDGPARRQARHRHRAPAPALRAR